ncbi:MAG: flagellar assembly peptidoglycan hydrolase FlgJ [Pseudomonadota bacterium]
MAGPTFADVNVLGDMRAEAARQDPAALREAARQFEAVFTHMMLKSMRAASLGEGIFDSKQSEFHRDMFDQQMSLELSKGRGLGIAEIMVRQLGGVPESEEQGPLTMPVRQSAAVASAPPNPSDKPVSSPRDFVAKVLPHARKAARVLGLEPHLLIAQAALETGWGKRTIADAAGKDSNNLFGVKASGGWQGGKARVSTLEFADGVAERRQEDFRAYSSLAEGFADYVRLLAGNTRYSEALNKGGDAAGFAAALQSGGYATDPKYADKLEAIANGDTLATALGSIKEPINEPKQ